jgi:hypothetical protein
MIYPALSLGKTRLLSHSIRKHCVVSVSQLLYRSATKIFSHFLHKSVSGSGKPPARRSSSTREREVRKSYRETEQLYRGSRFLRGLRSSSKAMWVIHWLCRRVTAVVLLSGLSHWGLFFHISISFDGRLGPQNRKGTKSRHRQVKDYAPNHRSQHVSVAFLRQLIIRHIVRRSQSGRRLVVTSNYSKL